MSETAYEWIDGTVVYQRECDACDNGLLLAPARFCPKCGGSGFLLRHTTEQAKEGKA